MISRLKTANTKNINNIHRILFAAWLLGFGLVISAAAGQAKRPNLAIGKKASTFESGQRVVAMARRPGRIPAGTSCDEIMTSMDILPTLTNLGPWRLSELIKVPAAEWGEPVDGIRQVRYAGEPFEGKPTRVFAYYGQPAGDGPFPGIVLVHGGGGRAFKGWVEHWVKRGYAAIAMDLAGNGPDGRLPDGGPDQSHKAKFRPFTKETVDTVWTYYAVAAVIRAHSLVAAQPAVDKNRIGTMGVSWGGYLTCIVAGLDRRLKVAVPVYGCGFIHEDSIWVDDPVHGEFNKMSAEQRDLWAKNFDPSQYLPGVKFPILFRTGTNDKAYSLASHVRSSDLVDQALVTLSVVPRLVHTHIWSFPEIDVFVDMVLKEGKKMVRLTKTRFEGDEAFTSFSGPQGEMKCELHYTTDKGKWPERNWRVIPAKRNGYKITATLPEKGYIAFFFSATDDRGLYTSSCCQVRE